MMTLAVYEVKPGGGLDFQIGVWSDPEFTRRKAREHEARYPGRRFVAVDERTMQPIGED
jgi:hypothetical protein